MKNLKKKLINCYMKAIHLIYGISPRKVVFSSFSGKAYSDNPRAVSEALHEIAPDTDIVWVFNDPEQKKHLIPDYVRCVKSSNLLECYREMATAKVFVTNFSIPQIPKHKKQRFIQTWHGDKGFKKILYDSPFANTHSKISEEKEGFCDIAVCGSKFAEKVYRSAFRYTGALLKEGTPRNDRLLRKDLEYNKALKYTLNLAEDKKLLMYAPTLRREAGCNKEKQKVQDLDISKILDLLEQRDGCKWICMLRAHPAMVGLSGAGEDQRIIDVSGYEDMADLLLISDMLITDYSSCAGDFALTRRPVVLFQADRQEYLEKDRTFYFDIDESPYFVAQDQEQVQKIIENMTPEKAAQNCNAILEFYGDCESGHASESIAHIIKNWIETN